jgi:phosphoserine phosphatase
MKRKDNNMKKAFVFDFDDTLASTTCKVEVIYSDDWGQDSIVEELTASEFNTYELKADETFSFEQFKQVINPVALPLVSLAKEVSQENHNVFILSARPSEAVNPITEFLRSLNIEVKSVICVGGKPINIAKEKRTVLMSIIENHEVVYFFDDDKTNIQEADKLEGLKAKLS